MSTLNGQRGEKIMASLDKHLYNRNAYVDKLVDETFSPEVLADFKEAVKNIKKFPTGSLTPAVICKLMLSAYLFKNYASLEQLLSKTDLRGIHSREGSGLKKIGSRNIQLKGDKKYGTNGEQYTKVLADLDKYFLPVELDASETAISIELAKEFTKFSQNKNQKFSTVITPEFVVEKYLDNFSDDKPCLADISFLLSRYTCSCTLEQNREYIQTVASAIKANLSLKGFGEKFTEEILPVGDSFKKSFLGSKAENVSEYYWKRKHMNVWYNLLNCYGFSLINKAVDAEHVIKQLLEPLAGSLFANVWPECKFVCFTKGNVSEKFHTRIFGVYSMGEYKKMLKVTLKYYEVYTKSFKNYKDKFDDIVKSIFLPCISVQAPYDDIRDIVNYGRLFSKLRIW